MSEKIINGIAVSESVSSATNNNIYYSQIAVDELQNTIKRLQKENEGLKADLKGETEQCQKWYQLETDKHFQMLKYEQALEEIKEKLKQIKEIAQGMHDWWINKTPYTDVYELAEHLLGTELNRILGVLEDSEDVEKD